jgi:hypothetical protein
LATAGCQDSTSPPPPGAPLDDAINRLILATEYLPYSEVQAWGSFLAEQELALAPAYTQGEHDFSAFAVLVRGLADQGVPVMVWPMLSEQDGRYLNVQTWPAFNAFTRELMSRIRSAGLPISWILLNLEMHSRIVEFLSDAFREGGLQGVIDYLAANADLERYEEAAGEIISLVEDAHAAGFRVAASTLWVVLDDFADGDRTLQQLFTTPIQDIAWDAVAYQVYRGGFNADLREICPSLQFGHAFVYDYAVTILEHHPDTGGLSLGSLPLVDNPPDGYATLEDLRGDFAAARAAGLTRNRISIWSLDGLSLLDEPAAWVDYDGVEAVVPEPDGLTREFRRLVSSFDAALGEEYPP